MSPHPILRIGDPATHAVVGGRLAAFAETVSRMLHARTVRSDRVELAGSPDGAPSVTVSVMPAKDGAAIHLRHSLRLDSTTFLRIDDELQCFAQTPDLRDGDAASLAEDSVTRAMRLWRQAEHASVKPDLPPCYDPVVSYVGAALAADIGTDAEWAIVRMGHDGVVIVGGNGQGRIEPEHQKRLVELCSPVPYLSTAGGILSGLRVFIPGGMRRVERLDSVQTLRVMRDPAYHGLPFRLANGAAA